jgi:ribosomal protein S18 acetylase RimI-like enzyme
MSDEISIAPARVDEWPKYKALRLEALRTDPQAFGSAYEDEVAKADEDWIKTIRAASQPDADILLIARHGEQWVGMAGAFFGKAQKRQHLATIWGVYVNPQYRGRGIGKRLLEAVLREVAGRPGILKVTLSVTTDQLAAIGLYQRLGFNVIGRAAKELKVGEILRRVI